MPSPDATGAPVASREIHPHICRDLSRNAGWEALIRAEGARWSCCTQRGTLWLGPWSTSVLSRSCALRGVVGVVTADGDCDCRGMVGVVEHVLLGDAERGGRGEGFAGAEVSCVAGMGPA